jgi:hypothetical protein
LLIADVARLLRRADAAAAVPAEPARLSGGGRRDALLAPRGVDTMPGMPIVGRIGERIDPRVLIVPGLALTAYSLQAMSRFDADVSA